MSTNFLENTTQHCTHDAAKHPANHPIFIEISSRSIEGVISRSFPPTEMMTDNSETLPAYPSSSCDKHPLPHPPSGFLSSSLQSNKKALYVTCIGILLLLLDYTTGVYLILSHYSHPSVTGVSHPFVDSPHESPHFRSPRRHQILEEGWKSRTLPPHTHPFLRPGVETNFLWMCL